MATAPQGSKRRIHHWGGLKIEGDGLELESRTFPATLNGQPLATLGDISGLLTVLTIPQTVILPGSPLLPLVYGTFNPSYPTVFTKSADSETFALHPPGIFRLDVDIPLHVALGVGLTSVSTHWKVFLLENSVVVGSFETDVMNFVGSSPPDARVKGSFLVFKPTEIATAVAYNLGVQMVVTDGADGSNVYTLLPGKLSLEHSRIRTNL